MICPNCTFDSPKEMLFCGQCGTQLGYSCLNCEFVNPLNFRYCGRCGSRLTVQDAAERITSPAIEQPSTSDQPVESSITRPVQPVELQQLVGERRLATVILADVLKSTDLLKQIGTETWVEVMNHVFRLLENEIYRFGGVVDQFRGDGMVAFFGTAGANEDDPERAILAGLAMQRAMKKYSSDLSKHLDIELKIRVGINTGEIIVTSIGDRSKHWEDTAMGEAVAIAARMEEAAEPETVLVSEDTYQLVRDRFKWKPLGEITVKGVQTPLSVYRPVELVANEVFDSPRQDFHFSTILTGRNEEIQLLSSSIEELYGGSGGITMISGETGLGKSFLISIARQHFEREEMLRIEALETRNVAEKNKSDPSPKLTWISGSCRSYDQDWPYSMWIDMLQKWIEMRPDESRQEASIRLHTQCEGLWGTRAAGYYPYLAAFLSLPLEGEHLERVRHLDGEGLKKQIHQAVRSWIEQVSQSGPTILVFNDIHWADSSALELLRHCIPLVDNQALLWIFTMRPDRASSAWELRQHIETRYPHRLTTLDLRPLSDSEVSDLLETSISSSALSEETRQIIIKNSDGNPYYVQELLRALIIQGILVLDPETGFYKETRTVDSIDLPDSLQSLVLARIDRASTEERKVIQYASVIGRVFWWNVLKALNGDSTRLQKSLTTLQRNDLISERSLFPILGMEYVFNSPLIRDVAYESLLSSQRAEIHLNVATYLESCTGLDGWAQYYSLIAYHYHNAGNQRKELFYTLQAAEQALAIYANAEAYRDYSNALDLLEQLEAECKNEDQLYVIRTQRFEVLKSRGKLSNIMGDISSGLSDLSALLPLAQQLGDDLAWTIDALLIQQNVVHPNTQVALQQALPMVHKALALSVKIADSDRELRSLSALSRLQFLSRDPERYQTAEKALALARDLGDKASEADLLLLLGSASGMDDLEKQQVYLETALSICHILDDRKREISLLHTIGEQFERSGDYYRQLTEYELVRLQISQEIGDRQEEAHALMFSGQVQGIYLGDYSRGLEMEKQSAQIWDKVTDRLYPLLRQAQIYIQLKDYREAHKILVSIRSNVEESIIDVSRAGYELLWIIYNNKVGEPDHLQNSLLSIQRIYQMTKENKVSRQYQLAAACKASLTYLLQADLAQDDGDKLEYLQKALTSSNQALDLYNQFGFVRLAECVSEEILFNHSLALAANGRNTEADEVLSQAYAEMMRKANLIPEDSSFRQSYLHNIKLHDEILQRSEALIQD